MAVAILVLSLVATLAMEGSVSTVSSDVINDANALELPVEETTIPQAEIPAAEEEAPAEVE